MSWCDATGDWEDAEAAAWAIPKPLGGGAESAWARTKRSRDEADVAELRELRAQAASVPRKGRNAFIFYSKHRHAGVAAVHADLTHHQVSGLLAQ
eukprot:5086191-Prymnesium_polylepis.1